MKQVPKAVKLTSRCVAYASLSTAAVTVFTLIGFSSAQFYFNAGDTVVLIASALFGPFIGMIAGGVGSFLADLIIYPATMIFTLIIKGVEGLVAGSLLYVIRKKIKNKKLAAGLSITAMAVSAYLMAVGYFICQTFFYGTYGSAIIALPMDALQATISFILASALLYPLNLYKLRNKLSLEITIKKKAPENKDTDTPNADNAESSDDGNKEDIV